MKRFLLPVLALSLSGCVNVDIPLGRSSELQEVLLEDSEGFFAGDKILVLEIGGIIADDPGGGFFGSDLACTPAYVRAALRKAREDDRVKAVVLRIDSPGGTVGASEIVAREIVQFRKATGRRVIAQIGSLGCSGAYYLAAGCDAIHMQPSGITGSIGVIGVFPKYRKLADKVGFEEVVIKSGALKDIGSGMRDMTDEERQVLQNLIDTSYDAFLDWILAHRPAVGDRATLKKLADGRIFTAEQAVGHKLADRACFLDESIAAAKEGAGLTDAQVVTYSYNDNADANIYSPGARANPLRLGASLPPVLQNRGPGFYYLWQPGN